MARLLKIYFLSITFPFCLLINSQTISPKLVVAVVVDQMKYEYVDRFWSNYGDNGIKKLTKNGAFCRNTNYNYIPTYTGPGHASIFTGTSPSVHGIIGNNWYNRKDFSPVYCAGDWNSQTICLCKKPHQANEIGNGQMSPNELLSNTIGDQLKLCDTLSKVFGVSIKDRGAILSTGPLANGAYWLNNNGQWITSSFYNNKLPNWVVDFHKESPADSYMRGSWKGSSFDIDLKKLVNKNGISAIKGTPKGNDFTLDFAKRLILEEKLGMDDHTDLIVVSFSSTDYVGHRYGPDAEHVQSTYTSFDKNISNMISFLDQEIGEGKYIIMLTSDHGAGTSPSELDKRRLKGGNFKSREVLGNLNEVLKNNFNVDNLVARHANMQFYLNYSKMDSLKISFDKVYNIMNQVLLKEPSIKEVFNRNTLLAYPPTKTTKMLINGIHNERSGDVFIILNPGYIEWSSKEGTSHGTHYNYDTHVPLFFYGAGITARQIYDKVNICDIAPTLSVLMNIGFPNACTGNPIGAVLK